MMADVLPPPTLAGSREVCDTSSGRQKFEDDSIPAPTAYRMSVQPGVRGNMDVARNDTSVLQKLNELLQRNMDLYENIYFAGRHGKYRSPL